MHFVVNNTYFSTNNLGFYPFASVVFKKFSFLIRPIAQSVYVTAAQDAMLRKAHLILNQEGAIRFLHRYLAQQASSSTHKQSINLYRIEHALINKKEPETRMCRIDDLNTALLRIVGVHMVLYILSRYYTNPRLSDVIQWGNYRTKNKNKNVIISIEDIYGIIFEFMNGNLRSQFVIYQNGFEPIIDSGPINMRITARLTREADESDDNDLRDSLVTHYSSDMNIKYIINHVLAAKKWHIHDKYILDDFYEINYNKDTSDLNILIIVRYLEFFLFALSLSSPLRLAHMISAMVNKIEMHRRKFEGN